MVVVTKLFIMNKYELRTQRLFFIRNHYEMTHDELLGSLRTGLLISKKYCKRNLLVDIWYIENGGNRSFRNVGLNETCGDFIQHIWLKIIIQALIDYASGRPCDSGIWTTDAPPMGKLKCSKVEHFCMDDAEDFLLHEAIRFEGVCGLSHGTIEELMEKIKKGTCVSTLLD